MAYLLTKLMGAGAAASLAEAFGSDSADNKTAIGTSQSTAFETSTAIARFTTVASGTGCILSKGARGDSQIVINAGANDLSVYPHVGAKINGLSTNAAFVLAAGTWGSFERVTDAQWQAKSDSAANLSFVQSGTAPASRTVQAKGREVEFSLMDKSGAVADGTTDLSTQWANIIADANAQVSAAVLSGFPISTVKITVPPGDYYIATGASVVNCNLIIEGKGRENTRIRVGAGQYLLTATGTVYQLTLRGISFSGGKGYFAHTNTAANVQGFVVIEDNNFHDYTECAAGSLSVDFPYWSVRRNTFHGTVALTSKGLVLMGDNSGALIEYNTFNRNRYHIKLAKGGLSVKIQNENAFMRFTSGGGAPALTDIWIIPEPSVDANAGQGFVCLANKFGNEGLHAADYRVLVADEGAGTNAFDKNHATTVSTGIWHSPRFLANDWAGAGTPTNGIIYSYTPNIRDLNFDDLLRGVGGSQYPYILHYDAAVTFVDDRSSTSNLIRINQENPDDSQLNAFSNAPSTALVDDPFGLHQGRNYNIQRFPKGFDPGYAAIGLTAINSAGLVNATVAAATDGVGGADAATITYSAAGEAAYVYLTLTMGNITVGRRVWVEFDYQVAATLPLTSLDCYIGDTSLRAERRYLPAATQLVTARIPWVPRQKVTQLYVLFSPGDYSAGVKTKIIVGRVRAYHATESINFGYFPQGIAPGGFTAGTGAALTPVPQRIVFGNAAPTAGAWIVGDIVINQAPAVASPKGWQCTVAGTPGTWVSQGNL